MRSDRQKPRLDDADRRRWLGYVAIAYGWTWALWIPALVYSARTGFTLPTLEAGMDAWSGLSGVELLVAIAFQLAVYGPLVGALVVLATMDRQRIAAWRSAWVPSTSLRWWGFVLVWPLALGAFVLLAGTVMGGATPKWSAIPALPVLAGMVVVQLLTSGLEEPGWRGYAWPLLRRAHGFESAGWLLGLVWAGWHLPFVLYLNRAAPVWSIPLTLAGFTMSIVAMGYVQAWVFERAGSLPLNITLHAWANVVNTIVAAAQPNPIVPLATAGFAWVFAAWILRREKNSAETA